MPFEAQPKKSLFWSVLAIFVHLLAGLQTRVWSVGVRVLLRIGLVAGPRIELVAGPRIELVAGLSWTPPTVILQHKSKLEKKFVPKKNFPPAAEM